LAWLATASSAVGGFCEKPTTVNGALKSLNSGMVTVVNFNARVPDRVQQITFAHEMGHNFGSTHDLTTDATCSPGGTRGNFIMYSRATNGKLANNDDFSSCSQNLIGSVLDFVVQGSKNCLKSKLKILFIKIIFYLVIIKN
jgi:disintegrin and metalloproteinase domain-containing protein 10